jgi:hypothetical protein
MERSSKFNVLYTAIGRGFLGGDFTKKALDEINNVATKHHNIDLSEAFFIRVASLPSCDDAGGGSKFHTAERKTKSVENFVQTQGRDNFKPKTIYGDHYRPGAGIGCFSKEDKKNIEKKEKEFMEKDKENITLDEAHEAAKSWVHMKHKAETGGEVFLAWREEGRQVEGE